MDDLPNTKTLRRIGGKRLSSVLTLVYKLGFSATIVTIGFAVTITLVVLNPGRIDVSILGLALPWTFMILLAYACLRLKKVVAHNDHLVISNYITESYVSYDDIEEIKGYRGRSVVFVRLRLRNSCRFGRTVHFLLPSIIASIGSQPEIQLLREKCPQLREQSRSWWRRTLYLRPCASRQVE